MKAIQDVPIDGTQFLGVEIESKHGTYKLAIEFTDIGALFVKIAELKRSGEWNPTFSADGFQVKRMYRPLKREEIEQSIRRMQSRRPRTLLTVLQDDVFPDDLRVSDYWLTDWEMTLEILRRLEAES